MYWVLGVSHPNLPAGAEDGEWWRMMVDAGGGWGRMVDAGGGWGRMVEEAVTTLSNAIAAQL